MVRREARGFEEVAIDVLHEDVGSPTAWLETVTCYLAVRYTYFNRPDFIVLSILSNGEVGECFFVSPTLRDSYRFTELLEIHVKTGAGEYSPEVATRRQLRDFRDNPPVLKTLQRLTTKLTSV